MSMLNAVWCINMLRTLQSKFLNNLSSLYGILFSIEILSRVNKSYLKATSSTIRCLRNFRYFWQLHIYDSIHTYTRWNIDWLMVNSHDSSFFLVRLLEINDFNFSVKRIHLCSSPASNFVQISKFIWRYKCDMRKLKPKSASFFN